MTLPSPSPKAVGIDISKDFLDVAAHGDPSVQRFANDEQGHLALLAWLRSFPLRTIVLEASGGYELPLLVTLFAAGLPAARVNPRKIRDFARSLGYFEKNDALDAKVLAHFGDRMDPPATPLPPEECRLFDQKLTRRRQLIAMLVAERNRLQLVTDKLVRKDIQETISFLSKRLKDLDRDLDKQLKKCPEWDGRVELLDSVPGIARLSAMSIVNALPELGQLNRKQIAKMAGLAPLAQDSGKKKGKRRIFGGRAEVRPVLYMVVMTALRFNPPLRSLYQALLKAGKPKKVAMVALMRKLLTILNAMVRSHSPWSPALAAAH